MIDAKISGAAALLFVLLSTSGCASGDAPDGDPATSDSPAQESSDRAPIPVADLEFLVQPVNQLDELQNGVIALGLGPMARSFVIHPELSPDADALATFARSAHAAGRDVHATAWIRARPAKGSPEQPGVEWPFVIVRLADSPDPRRVE